MQTQRLARLIMTVCTRLWLGARAPVPAIRLGGRPSRCGLCVLHPARKRTSQPRLQATLVILYTFFLFFHHARLSSKSSYVCPSMITISEPDCSNSAGIAVHRCERRRFLQYTSTLERMQVTRTSLKAIIIARSYFITSSCPFSSFAEDGCKENIII